MWKWAGYSMNTVPVFGPSYGYVISPPNLVAIDPTLKTSAWTANGAYTGTPALAGGIVYAISAGNLIARDATTGKLISTMVGDQNLKYPPIVAGGYVYASSDANVYAWDRTSHAQIWTAPAGGWLSVASRRLLVASSDGVLHGFVLSP
jgi:outer membrane protein assembly factor BamB